MKVAAVFVPSDPIYVPGGESFARAGSGVVAGAASLALVINAAFYESFNSSYLMLASTFLLLLAVLIRRELLFCREFLLYAAFVGYMFLMLLWTPDVALALNTLFPAVDSVLLLLLFGSLAAYHDRKAVFTGAFVGFLVGAVAYARATGFPLAYPKDFSYNAIAGMYLFGLICALAYGWAADARVLPLLAALVLMVHVAATTSIKTNLGIALAAGLTGAFYIRHSLRILAQNVVYLIIAAVAIVYAIISDQALLHRVSAGLDRVELGLKVLQLRSDVAGYGGYGERQHWMQEGLRAWVHNPLFGYGVEAFRRQYSITSHSTPIDLLYNSGAIGLLLYYGVFLSLALRLVHARESELRGIKALIFGSLVCYLFISLSAIVHYDPFVAAFVGMSAATLIRYSRQPRIDARSFGGAPDSHR